MILYQRERVLERIIRFYHWSSIVFFLVSIFLPNMYNLSSLSYLCCLSDTILVLGPQVFSSTPSSLYSTSGIRATLLFGGDEQQKAKNEVRTGWKKRPRQQSLTSKRWCLRLAQRGNPEVWRKKFSLWKELMQDVLIIRSPIEGIRHNNINDSWRVAFTVRDSQVDHSNAPSQKCVFQHGKGDNNILLVGQTSGRIQKKSSSSKLLLIRQLFNMKIDLDGSCDLSHQHLL
mgnify:CR=1 FL=1